MFVDAIVVVLLVYITFQLVRLNEQISHFRDEMTPPDEFDLWSVFMDMVENDENNKEEDGDDW